MVITRVPYALGNLCSRWFILKFYNTIHSTIISDEAATHSSLRKWRQRTHGNMALVFLWNLQLQSNVTFIFGRDKRVGNCHSFNQQYRGFCDNIMEFLIKIKLNPALYWCTVYLFLTVEDTENRQKKILICFQEIKKDFYFLCKLFRYPHPSSLHIQKNTMLFQTPSPSTHTQSAFVRYHRPIGCFHSHGTHQPSSSS